MIAPRCLRALRRGGGAGRARRDHDPGVDSRRRRGAIFLRRGVGPRQAGGLAGGASHAASTRWISATPAPSSRPSSIARSRRRRSASWPICAIAASPSSNSNSTSATAAPSCSTSIRGRGPGSRSAPRRASIFPGFNGGSRWAKPFLACVDRPAAPGPMPHATWCRPVDRSSTAPSPSPTMPVRCSARRPSLPSRRTIPGLRSPTCR